MANYLRSGAAAGAIGGLVLALFLLVVAEPTIDAAVAAEATAEGFSHDDADSAPFTRSEQKAGGALGALLVGVAFGAIFGVTFAALRHRLPGTDDWARAMWLGGAAWVTVHLVPALKYPPNPPGLSDGGTVGDRTVQFLLLVGVAIGALALAWRAAIALRRWPIHLRMPVAAATWLVIVAVALAVFPARHLDASAPAQLVWDFRLRSLSGSCLSWASMSCAFGLLLQRSAGRARAASLT